MENSMLILSSLTVKKTTEGLIQKNTTLYFGFITCKDVKEMTIIAQTMPELGWGRQNYNVKRSSYFMWNDPILTLNS